MQHELALVGIYFSPLLPIVLFGILARWRRRLC